MQVTLSTHATERLNQRLNVRARPGTCVNIADITILARKYSYKHKDTGHFIDHYISRDTKNSVVFVVDRDTKCVVTLIHINNSSTQYWKDMYNTVMGAQNA